MYYPVHTSKWIQRLFPNYLWRMETTTINRLFLTFDDGPIPVVTPWVLEQLAKYNAKATFFCVGENVQKNPSIYQQLLAAGHQVGNHTFNHLNGWKTSKEAYLTNVAACQEMVASSLFRPPYGRLRWRQAKQLKQYYKIVMWDVIAGDFDASISGETCWKNVKNNSTNGSIIVLHDSQKAWERLKYTLPKLLAYYHEQGFVFEAINADLNCL